MFRLLSVSPVAIKCNCQLPDVVHEFSKNLTYTAADANNGGWHGQVLGADFSSICFLKDLFSVLLSVRFNPKLDGNLSIAAGQVSDEIDFSVDDEVGLGTKLRDHHLGC